MNRSYVISVQLKKHFTRLLANTSKVELVELSMQQKDVLTVLLTGRAESAFSDIVKRIIASRSLEFDIVCLKPEIGPNSQRFSSTINFKQIFLEDLIFTYKNADEIRVYEDRIRQYVFHVSASVTRC